MARKRITYVLLALAAVLLLGSAVGGTRAALTYYSENYTAEITVSQIGVSLLENGQVVSSRDYKQNEWQAVTNRGKDSVNGALLLNMLEPEEKLALNKEYEERLTVKNSGSIDEYVRVRIYRYWMKDGKKVTTLSPDLIDLNLVSQDVWVKGPNETVECTELFYKGILPSGEESEAFADTIRIDGAVAAEAKVERNGSTITTTYKYDGVEFHVDVEVDAVQTHNAQDAIRSAWGVDAESLGIL
ncbi:MAG: hypothetical protein HFI67_08635 [Lachnospiraceae bacterium]|jgi:hypothetical protein|nr:hypothetical protein [Lachnospiraceae bacterium]